MTALPVPSGHDWSAIAGETTLAATVIASLVVPFFTRAKTNLAVGCVALIGVLIALGVVTFGTTAGPAFGGMVTADPAACFWRQVLLAFTAGVIGLWLCGTRKAVPDGDGPEFVTLLLSSVIGLSLMGATSNLLMLVLATELASMPSYVLVGFRKTNRQAAEGALKYVLFGAVCTGAMIYGLSLLYGVAGGLDAGAWLASAMTLSPLAIVGLLLLGVGLLFKIAAVPLHFWCPDAFEGAGVDVTAFLSVASKGAAVVLLARLWHAAGGVVGPNGTAIAVTLAVVAVLTTTVGNLGALRQQGMKRLLAYSSIAHAGYLLSALAILPNGLTATMIYLAVYAIMNLGAFAVTADVERSHDSDAIDGFAGLSNRTPLAAAAMAVCLVSMVGLPPAAGFIAKWKIMAALASAGGWWWMLVASVAVNSVVSLAFYARVLRAMYLRPAASPSVDVRTPSVPIAGVCAGLLIVGLIGFALVEKWAGWATFAAGVQAP